MLIRDADADRDAAACARIYSSFVTGTVVSLEEDPPGESEMARRIMRISAAYPWLAAEADGETAGFAYASRHRERAAYRWAADVSVYVDPRHHRRGIGSALLRQLLALLRRQGLWMACAGITLPNEASVALHEALGFAPVGIYRRIGYKNAAWQDVGCWQRPLRPVADGPPPEPGPPVRLEA
ncbi:MAG: N-acetyltransferase family protein [Actinomycetota bacterium]|nr:N-acetyltransferase family protein [Actinomycetota bacterium]